MKYRNTPRRLHMGCGEELTGRLPRPTGTNAPVSPLSALRRTGSKAGKDRR